MVKKPHIFLQLLFVLVTSIYASFLLVYPVYADEASDLLQQIEQKNQELLQKQSTLSTIEAKIKEISGSNNTVSQKIALINDEVAKLDASIASNSEALSTKIKEIEDRQLLISQKKVEMDKLSTDLYIRSRYRMATFFLSGNDWDTLVKEFFLKQSTISLLKQEVEDINGEFSSLEESRALLETEKTNLEAQKKDMDDSYALLAAEKAKLQAELKTQNSTKSSLTKTIGSLSKEVSQLQQYLYYIKSGGTVVDINSIPTSGSDTASTPGFFRTSAPAGSFAVFSFGAYTWRRGLSQYGADVRASQYGQSYQTILSTYYPGTTFDTATMSTIKIRHCGNRGANDSCSVCNYPTYSDPIDFEDNYMKKIAEMPDNYAMEALKAQAVAARTYAIKETNYGVNYIDDDECDQAYNANVNKPNWEAAVAATRNQVLISGGVLANTPYAAMHGGYSFDMGWDSIDGTGTLEQIYEAKSTQYGSYWFYRQWFRKGYYASGNDCGHTPYLSNVEMADILNAYLRWTQVKSDPRIVAVDTTTCWKEAANPYSMAELKSVVANPISNVYSAFVANSNGTTTSILFRTDRGDISISGTDFKFIYNTRAPGFMRIPQNTNSSGSVNIININIEYK